MRSTVPTEVPPSTSTAIEAVSVGVRPTRTPRASSASAFADAFRAAPQPVVVAPGGRVHFGIGIVTNNEYAHARACHTAAAAVAAAPGAQMLWRRVSLRRAPRISPCGNQLTISPVHA